MYSIDFEKFIFPPPPRVLKTVHIIVAAVAAVALMYGAAGSAEAHYGGYFDGVIDVFDYNVVEYADFDLVRMTVQIENLQRGASIDYLRLATDDGSVVGHATYADVRGKGAEVSVDDCASNGRAPHIPQNGVANMTACFMVKSGFGEDPSGLQVEFDRHRHCDKYGYNCNDHRESYQIVPFHEESAYCFVENPAHCNANNIQHVDTTPEPKPPAPEPEPTEPASPTLLYTIYNNHTGALTLVFDSMVVANNPDRIHMVHDIDAFIEEGTAPSLGGSELYTVDNKRQSMILVFELDGELMTAVAESLRTHGDLALYIDTRAVYSAEGFVDMTDGSPVLVPDILVVR